MRTPFRALCTLVAFLASVFLLNRFLGWPTSTLNLFGLVGISFVVGGLVSDLVSRKEGNRIGLMAITAISIFLVAGSLTAGWPWDYRVSYLRGQEKYVTFKQEAALYLLSTEDNGPLENLDFYFLAPHAENKLIIDENENPMYKGMVHVFYLGENGALLLQCLTQNGKDWDVVKFYGQRQEVPRFDGFINPNSLCINRFINKLYPREVFWAVEVVRVPERDAKKISIRDLSKKEDVTKAGFTHVFPDNSVGPFDKKATVYFWIHLSRLEENGAFETLATYSGRFENTTGDLYYELYSPT
jgi:hypothetical protein